MSESHLDATTAKLLLQAALVSGDPANNDAAVDLYHEFTRDTDEISEEDLAFANEHTGKPCEIINTNNKGVIRGPNMATSGLYPGGRYPVLVDIVTDEGHETLEYDVSQINITGDVS